jgi:hypothetical protein
MVFALEVLLACGNLNLRLRVGEPASLSEAPTRGSENRHLLPALNPRTTPVLNIGVWQNFPISALLKTLGFCAARAPAVFAVQSPTRETGVAVRIDAKRLCSLAFH